MSDIKYLQIIAIVILLVAIKLYTDHRKSDYKGIYNIKGNYENISDVKREISRILFVSLFPILIFGLAPGEKFIDTNNMMQSRLGKILVTAAGYFVYHELIQPYIINKLPFL